MLLVSGDGGEGKRHDKREPLSRQDDGPLRAGFSQWEQGGMGTLRVADDPHIRDNPHSDGSDTRPTGTNPLIGASFPVGGSSTE